MKKLRKIISLSLVHIMFVTYLFPMQSVAQSAAAGTQTASETNISQARENLTRIRTLVDRMRIKSKDSPLWLRGPHLQKVFQNVSQKLNLYSFLNTKQKELLKKDPKETDRALDEKIKKEDVTEQKELAKPGVMAGVIRNYLLIYALAIIGIVKDDFQKSQVLSQSMSSVETGTKLVVAIREIVDSGEIPLSMVSAGITHKALKIPLDYIQSLISNTKIGPLFKNFLIHFTATLVSFVGWEFGGQLWKEATNMLDFQLTDINEREFLKDRNHILYNLYSATKVSKTGRTEEAKAAGRVLTQIVTNVLKILTLGSEMQTQWIYNSVRMRIVNGHFVTLVTSMAAASAVGTTIFPLAGTFLGAAFGLAGGVATIIIPEDWKNEVTLAIKNQWIDIKNNTFGTGTESLLKAGFDQNQMSIHTRGVSVDDAILRRLSFRESLVDTYIERIYYANGIIAANNEKISNYVLAKPTTSDPKKVDDEIEKLSKENVKYFRSLTVSLTKIISLYLSEAQLFEGLKRTAAMQIQEKYETEKVSSENMLTHFCSFTDGFLKLDYLSIQAWIKKSTDSSDLVKIETMCRKALPSTYGTYKEMPEAEKKVYDSAIKFLEKTYWSKLKEQVVTLDRLDEILTLN